MNMRPIIIAMHDSYLRVLFIFSMAVWLCVVALFFLLIPVIEHHRETDKQLRIAKAEYSFRGSIAEQVRDLDKLVAVVADANAKLHAPLNNSEMIFRIAGVLAKHDTQVLSENYSNVRHDKKLSWFEADLKVSTNYKDLKLLIEDFSTFPNYVQIKKLTLAKGEKQIVAEIQARIMTSREAPL